ncbi:MAG: selenocysteine-specific translation elongation factor [Betaproteobacteria bacterium]
MIVATAGHVDHGKTSLVRALTGVDTDRLPEEKRRGMTIDLGFAYLGPLGFVDVPGPERFVHNMLAGVGGIDYALLVVAADDGPMPQTREHLAILGLLGVRRAAVGLTKIDRVPPERINGVRREIEGLLSARVFPLSSVTGQGVQELKAHLLEEAKATAPRAAQGNFRLSVDRCFTVAGAGLVVTGTAIAGEVAVGDEVRVLLAGSPARVRSIHAQNAPASRGRAGERLALNLTGVDKAAIARGDWIVKGNVPAAAAKIDATLECIGEPIKHWTPVHVHLGAAEAMGRIAVLDLPLVQLVLEEPIGAVRGDRFIVRDQSARRTLGGGTVIDLFPPPRGRAKPERLAWLRAMAIEDHEAALAALLEASPAGVDMARFSANRNLPAQKGWRFSPGHWRALREKALASLAAWHARAPESVGPAEDRILEGAGPRLAREAVLGLAEELAREGAIVREGTGVRLPSHRPRLAPADAALWQRIAPRLEEAALRPPTVGELALALGGDAQRLESALSRLARHGLVVRVSKNRFFPPAALRRLAEAAEAEAAERGAITAAAFRDRTRIGRNLTIEVLEYFDRVKFTRRTGDAHILQNRGQTPISGDAKL